MNNNGSQAICKTKKMKLGEQNNDEGSINLAGANENATLNCKKKIIKTLAKLYESAYCHSLHFGWLGSELFRLLLG